MVFKLKLDHPSPYRTENVPTASKHYRGNHLQSTVLSMTEHLNTVYQTPMQDRYMDYVFSVRAARVTTGSKMSSTSRSWPGWYMPGRVSAPQATSTLNKRRSISQQVQTSQILQSDYSCITEQLDKADQSLFETVLTDHHHVLYRLLPTNKTHKYTLRPYSV